VQAVAIDDGAAHQQPAVAGQQDALLAGGYLRQLGVVPIVLVDRVEAEQAQVGRKLAEMDVAQEAGRPGQRRAQQLRALR